VNIGVEADDIGIGAGVDHVAFCLENVAALMNHYSRLTEAGIEPVWSITGIFNMVTNSPNTREFEGEASYNIG
ncbi:MAG: hypothetical protein GWP45_01500, partial [Proteobacteria bacterium]|nr:hypothetical protein [Pseudomonadota bacterium]